MKIIDAINKINKEEKFRFRLLCNGDIYKYIGGSLYNETVGERAEWIIDNEWLNQEIEIIEEEKEIPEKHINNYGDLIILGQQDNWLKTTIETDKKRIVQLNPYVFEAINENFKDIENKIYEIIDCLDYLKSKGDE